MRIIKAIIIVFVLVGFVLINANLVFSQDEQESEEIALDEELEQELKWLQAETYVITPSKIPEKIKKTAASITVVTDKQIRQMGAKDLQDVIVRVVPSFWLLNDIGWPHIHTRGASFNRVLIMINSLPLYDADLQGMHYFNYIKLNMDNVKRIEFIRGPGSALYGANAYNGVINIITKKAEDVDGVELTARGGSWDTQEYNLLFGKTFNYMEATFNFNYLKSHGNRAFIKADVFSYFDENVYEPLGFPPASMAPGYTNEHERKYDLSLNLKYKGFIFDGGYMNRQWNLPLDSMWCILTEKNTWSYETYYLNLGYETTLGDKLDLSAKVYRLPEESLYDIQEWPPGTTDVFHDGSFGTVWPEGEFYVQKFNTSRTGMEIQATYKVSDSNTIVAGATYEKQKLYDQVWSNAEYLEDSEALIQLPSIQEIQSEYIGDQKYDFKALFSEDVWDITEDLRLTLGAHYIDYSSFGSHFSPRAGLTWEYKKGYDLKLIYGHAFSVPAYTETYQQSPGTILGPQTIDTYELSLGAEFTPSFESRITFFQNNNKDLITLLWQSGYLNMGELRSKGVEVEARYDFGRGTYIAGNYSYTSLGDGDSTIAAGADTSRVYLGKIMSNVRLSRYLNLCVDGYYINGWTSRPYDLSNHFSHRTIVNATLIARNLFKGYEGLELRGSVYNLFDEDWSEYVARSVTGGWPQPGIHFLLELKYKF